MKTLSLLVLLSPLVGALCAGLAGRFLGRVGTHTITILGVAVSLGVSCYLLFRLIHGEAAYNAMLYPWMSIYGITLQIGILVDSLSAMMMVVVSTVSLLVHVYTIGYMREDPGYSRFFSYISLFTFAMLTLVMSNNFVQLFFGWEAVGLISYLLIGFWYTKPSAIAANLKAFLVNRVGDFGFILGIGLIFSYFGSLDYTAVFAQAEGLHEKSITLFTGHPWSLMTVIGLLLFVGAMGKSAQFPLHVWLPDSMEGPTPISALIHAATMVTAGIFMVARMSPLYELSDTALNFILVIGAITALSMGILGMVQYDIKRIIAYSTLSQLGYMTMALGVSAYSVAVFHLMTHAFFKALLFLAAGSVIVGMHHQQDIRHMGGLRKGMPVTWVATLIGSLALIGAPFFSGFYSKDTILEAIALSTLPGAKWAYAAALMGIFVTAFYTFRLYFRVFHGPLATQNPIPHAMKAEALEPAHFHAPIPAHESPWVMTLPLIVLAVPSAILGFFAIEPMLYGTFFEFAIVSHAHPVMQQLKEKFEGAGPMALHAVTTPAFWLMVAGVFVAWWLYMKNRYNSQRLKQKFSLLFRILDKNYYIDTIYTQIFARGARIVGWVCWKVGDTWLIDGVFIHGLARQIGYFSQALKRAQNGLLNYYALSMIVSLMLLLAFWFQQTLFG